MKARQIARMLGGYVIGVDSVAAPGPGHSDRDRSLSILLDPAAPDGLIVNSFAGDDWRDCRAHVMARLGITPEDGNRKSRNHAVAAPRPAEDVARKIRLALDLWRASIDPRGTIAETYLRSRALNLPDEIAGDVLRWNPRMGALVALFRNVLTGEPQAVTRIYLDREGRKIERKFLGSVAGCAIMLDPFEDVTAGLHVGEGVETCLAGRQIGFRPAWALGLAGAIANFPVLPAVEALTIFAETDDSGANARAIEQVAAQWGAAGRETFVAEPTIAGDLNDVVRRANG